MINANKVKPQAIKGTIILLGKPSIKINDKAVGNNNSKKTSKEFIKSLRKAVEKEVFSNLLHQNGNQ